MKAIKKISKAAKAAGKLRVEYVDETASMISREGVDSDDDYSDDHDNVDIVNEVSQNWEKMAQVKRYFKSVVFMNNQSLHQFPLSTSRLKNIIYNVVVCQVQVLELMAQHPEGPGLPGLHHSDRGQATGRTQHGPCCMCTGRNNFKLFFTKCISFCSFKYE